MIYANHDFQYDHHENRPNEARRPDYGRARSNKAARKRSRKRVASSPGCGIGGRRQRRWSW